MTKVEYFLCLVVGFAGGCDFLFNGEIGRVVLNFCIEINKKYLCHHLLWLMHVFTMRLLILKQKAS